jgi:hypothetical protein
VELPLQLRDYHAHYLGRAGGGGNDVERRGAGSPQVLMKHIKNLLVIGIGVNRRHQSPGDSKAVIEDLYHGRHAVGCARCIRDDVMSRGVILALIHSEHDGDVLILAGG